MRRHLPLLILVSLLALSTALGAPDRVTISRAEFSDRVFACFLGKSIGGTLGMPDEGNRSTHNYTFFDPVPTEPAANDDLDLQLLWLKALQERGPRITALDLGEYWLKYVPVDWNEYGVGKANMRAGFMPPLSGQVRNERWRDSNGAWIRSEIWACVAPGCPWLAAKYAWEDACVDHGAGEGTWAEVFTAAVESAAFVESDRDKLIDIGLSYIPADCKVAASIRAAIAAWESGLDLMAAREAVVEASASTGWFMAPQNVAFVILGWLYGEGDFGRSICAAVNCGDDTDCTGATLGSLLGILGGTAAIPEEWRRPVGEEIRNVAIAGSDPPKTLSDLTEQVVAMAPTVLRAAGLKVATRPGGGVAVDVRGPELVQQDVAQALWRRSPYVIHYTFDGFTADLDYGQEPILGLRQSARMQLRLRNTADVAQSLSVEWSPPRGLVAHPKVHRLSLEPGGSEAVAAHVTLFDDEAAPAVFRGEVSVAADERAPVTMPLSFLYRLTVRADDLALGSRGATATSDSELDREPGCTAQAIDGTIPPADGFEGQRWHSALTPHPHWIAIDLQQSRSISRVIIHFADPAGHPVDFDAEASQDEVTWEPLFRERDYQDNRRCDRTIEPATLRHFRLTIHRSASDIYRDAAQVGEIELCGE